MSINYTFPSDFQGQFRGQPLAGVLAENGEVLDYGSEEAGKLMVEFRTKLGPTDRQSVRVLVAADSTPELLKMAREAVLRDLKVSETRVAAWPVEYINTEAATESGREIRLGRIMTNDWSGIPCTVRCQQRVDGTKRYRGHVFAVVDHPDHGRIAVAPIEALALGLPEITGIPEAAAA